MIKLTYQVICDICKKECDVQTYNCTNGYGEFPRPTTQYTFTFGFPTEMCYDCAAPLQAARDEVIRNINREAEKNGEDL